MMNKPFDHNYFIGYVNHVNPQFVKVHFPSSVLLNKFIFSGEEFNGGLIGDFVTIEGENYGFIGKILELDLPEKERLGLSEKAFQSSDFHPTAKVEILLSFDYFNYKEINKGLDCYPNIGSKVFVCPSEFIQDYLIRFGNKNYKDEPIMEIGTLTSNRNTTVIISQQALLSRHCAIVGTTGGGKSWSVARIIQHLKENGSKAILIDPTGEYLNLVDENTVSFNLGEDSFFHYEKLTVEDIFFLLKPAGRVQQPKLLEAIRSLKAYRIDEREGINELNEFKVDGIIKKAGKDRRKYDRFCYTNIEKIENGLLTFDIANLPRQITEECIYDSDKYDDKKYGGRNENDVSNCVSLISRASNLLNTGLFKELFGFDKDPIEESELTSIINKFLGDKDKGLLRISFEKVGFQFQAREIIANAIGKYMLTLARTMKFKENPIVLILDEAHQFLNNKVVDDYFENSSLTAFDQIAKECRKYGLFLCIATQMPRDIPVGTLSQMGTFLVHRLINYNDKESIRHACSSANSSVLSFLPVLGEGEAILTGIDFPMPLTIKINKPKLVPDSKTPRFKMKS
ncbi:ATP-binding protein [Paramaledivibacter caminithermalis]|uniref:AAA+ ATPase domain-containing protein n=1 Tax=Paramaledivibacter caminithermalis (strain DSM 15212 / CIP 107654 / DViRD3) TaxID=1121301 RepID=A0A1M6S9G2_PARC5|nr:ATP-binding protein [Paramaledivibacter caminithermalis]SHK41321.1 hypothetical protein SAMN02745912_03229 [Paramaledivibacter caminithermalis DSM 15212]